MMSPLLPKDSPKTAAVIPAAGKGLRTGLSTPKQFLPLLGIPVWIHAVRIFEASPLIEEIIMVVPRDAHESCREAIEVHGLKKVSRMVAGGDTRQDSVWAGLEQVSTEVEMVAVHDGVRPMLSDALLARTVRGCRGKEGCIPIIPFKDTPKRLSEGGTILSTLDRTGLVLAQTPQVFDKEILMEAYRRAYTDGIRATDDAALVERLGYPVRVVEGQWDNIKLTTAEDLQVAEALMKSRGPGETA